MKRIALTDEIGSWFDADKAELFKEETFHDGRNLISKATYSQWEHEYLFRTASGNYILNSWSNWQGSTETYKRIDFEEAAKWFAKQAYPEHVIPEDLKQLVDDYEI